MKRLKIGVIGVGIMGLNHIRNLVRENHFELAGFYDIRKEQAETVQETYQVKAWNDMDDLLDNVEAVVIAVPSSLHKEVGLKAVDHGVHALIEKPLAINSQDAKILNEAFSRKNLILTVGHIERFNSVIIELKKIIEDERIFYVEANRFSPYDGRIMDVGVVEDLMIHDIDLVCHLLGYERIKSIWGTGESLKTGYLDFATCILNFTSDAHAVINASRVSQSKERLISVHTENSCIVADLLQKNLTITKNTNMVIDSAGSDTYRQDGIVQKIFVPIKEPLREELFAFYRSVVDGCPVAVTGETAIKAIEICEKIVGQA